MKKMSFTEIYIVLLLLVALGYGISKYSIVEGSVVADVGLCLIGMMTIIEVSHWLVQKIRATHPSRDKPQQKEGNNY